MLFHTTEFAVFFSILLPVYLGLRRVGWGVPVLLLASQVFYGWWDWRFLFLLWTTVIVDYFIALRLAATETTWKRKALLALSLATSLSILGFFKYWNFLIESVDLVSPVQVPKLAGLILPVGVSFYTFQSIGYVIDVYRGKEAPVKNLLHYAAFVCYFPHMVAGPIMRIRRLMPAIVQPASFTVDRVLSGVLLFMYGFVCKAVGDMLAVLHDPVFRDVAGSAPADVVFAIVGFGLQIYFDFNGYTSMARGVSRILGIELMVNFRAPYTATSFRDFWRRWHISLSEWLRDYLYISLGGNRVHLPGRLRNLMITMLLGGLWHGAGWSFLIWGGLHGVYLSLNTLFDVRLGERLAGARFAWLRAALGWALTFIGVTYAWLYFRVPNIADALMANRQIVRWLRAPGLPPVAWGVVALVALLLVLDVWQRDRPDLVPLAELTPSRAMAFGLLAGAGATLGLVLLVGAPTQQFIYFQF